MLAPPPLTPPHKGEGNSGVPVMPAGSIPSFSRTRPSVAWKSRLLNGRRFLNRDHFLEPLRPASGFASAVTLTAKTVRFTTNVGLELRNPSQFPSPLWG